ncbi:hypothetical protein; putative exported protein [Bradyrhizobium sp. ORS 278]|uniref:hypothetical protein n=1 Tax=Bradyrhizobium sp. (strain ORS 278) TaxID=114615 RepID=UPI00015084CA|nr:hypothetical protein [Bradyrhizobium sp. ORS 278]CAL79450.1 hypothetical protein; putative exported protein [Bradyrhizobium sp. ORS 278]
MSWLKYVLAALIGCVTMVVFTVSASTSVLWLSTSWVVAHRCSRMPSVPNDCGGWAALGYAVPVVAGCALLGLFVGTTVGTMAGIRFYRRQQTLDASLFD